MSVLKKLGINPADLFTGKQYSKTQSQTQAAFSFQWSKRNTYDSNAVKTITQRYLFERYCNNNPKRLDAWLEGERKIILDAGCGSGFSALLFFGEHLKKHNYLGVDISDAVNIAKLRFRESGYPGEFLKMGLMDLSIPDETIDIIFCEGVLHHTDNTEKSFKFLSKKLKKKGRFLFYVYAKKGVIREFTDDYVRQCLAKLTDEDAWETIIPMTKLGIELGKINIELNVPEDIPLLGIHKGKISLQRFFYWNICKLFYRPEYALEEMNHMNFDWFRPLNCHRHTPEEVKKWCVEAGLEIEHINIQEAGITVVAIKR